MRHPCDHLSTVLARYSSMTSSDSILERDFSRLQQLLNCHRLAADEASEEDICLLMLLDPESDDKVLQQAGLPLLDRE